MYGENGYWFEILKKRITEDKQTDGPKIGVLKVNSVRLSGMVDMAYEAHLIDCDQERELRDMIGSWY